MWSLFLFGFLLVATGASLVRAAVQGKIWLHMMGTADRRESPGLFWWAVVFHAVVFSFAAYSLAGWWLHWPAPLAFLRSAQ
ncbi:MAG: hypothetical protein JSR45_17755 [Proteobacteria bacterium]|nr:hypothetical protein [Pseudomonadota bacterium]